MRHAFERVLYRMGEVVHRIHAPLVAEVVVRDMADTVDDGIAEVDVGRGHVDLRPEAPLSVRVLAVAHLVEDLHVALGSRVARRRGCARLLGNAAVLLPLVLRQVAAVGLPAADELLGDRVHLVEHVRRVVEARLASIALARPLEAEPADVLLDVLGVFVRLLRRIRVVETEVAFAPEELCHAEVYADGLGVPDMDIAVRLRREARDDLAAGLAVGYVLFDPLPEKMPRSI